MELFDAAAPEARLRGRQQLGQQLGRQRHLRQRQRHWQVRAEVVGVGAAELGGGGGVARAYSGDQAG